MDILIRFSMEANILENKNVRFHGLCMFELHILVANAIYFYAELFFLTFETYFDATKS